MSRLPEFRHAKVSLVVVDNHEFPNLSALLKDGGIFHIFLAGKSIFAVWVSRVRV